MRLILLSLAGVAWLGACSASPSGTAAAAAPAMSGGGQTPSMSSPPVDLAKRAPTDACGAAERHSWIGRPRAELPAVPRSANWRIYETGQPVTQDRRQDRLNVEIDPTTQTVVCVSCG